MSAEEFAAAKEARLRQMGAAIITVDQRYNPGQRAEQPPPPDEADTSAALVTAPEAVEPVRYQPKVSTWGMFPRPNDISKAYGGGRDIKPGSCTRAGQTHSKVPSHTCICFLL